MLKRLPLFLALLPLFLIVHVLAEYNGLLKLKLIASSIAWIFIAQLVIFLLSRLIAKNFKQAALITLVIAIPYFFFCDLKDYLHENYPDQFFSSYTFLVPAIILLITLSIRFTKKQEPKPNTFLFINLLFLLFIISDLTRLLTTSKPKIFAESKLALNTGNACDTCLKPDIYFLLFDAYTSSQTLKTEFAFDNSALEQYLTSNGFFVIRNSRSNYSLTPFSISSCFNMSYLEFLQPVKRIDLKTYLAAVDEVSQTTIPKYLQAKGYDLINYSIFNLQKTQPNVQQYDVWDQDDAITRHQFFRKMYNDLGWHFNGMISALKIDLIHDHHEQRDADLDQNLKDLRHHIAEPHARPRFVYAHFLIPHGPYSRGENGQEIRKIIINTESERKKAFVEQVKYANQIIKELVDSIKSNSKRPFIIMLQGDHGYRFDELANQSLEFPNLNAIYFSSKDYHHLRENQSLVNSFRSVLNTYFGENLPSLPDSSVELLYK